MFTFTTLLVQPLFNLLVLIYAVMPGHDFGLSIAIFTLLVQLAMWPLLKKQLHQTKQMRKMQPALKRIKQQAKGDRLKQQAMTMELYKEYGINPFSSFVLLIPRVIILFALYAALRKVIGDPGQIVSFAYPALQHLPWMAQLAHHTATFNRSLFGFVDLTREAVGTSVYWPAMVLVLGSAAMQYLQSKQLLVTDKNARSLRTIMKEAGEGKEADQAEISAAMGGYMSILMPITILFVTIHLPSALGLYWFVGGVITYVQQRILLQEDETELETLADSKATKDVAAIPEAEVAASQPTPHKDSSKIKSRRSKRRRRRK